MKSGSTWMKGGCIALSALTAVTFAQPGELPYGIAEIDRTENILTIMAAEGASIDYVSDSIVRAYLSQEEYDRAAERGWTIRWIPNEAAEMSKRVHEEGKRRGNAMLEYHSYEEIGEALAQYASDYPDLCRVSSAGQSIQGRELWWIKITDNPGVREPEPLMKYISTMHGDEPVGTEVMMDLIKRLLTEYETNDRLRTLVDETEIWIMPLMNPDGHSQVPAQRTNMNNRDLNRSFPRWACADPNSTAGRQPEVAAIIGWSQNHQEVLSANFHTGALLANYPLDECNQCEDYTCLSSFCDDDALVRQLALAYSLNHSRMSTSPDPSYATDGAINGAQWYPVYGGMQDWNYRWEGGMEVTLEINSAKFPPASQLETLVAENRESVLVYMEMIHRGVRGIMRHAVTGEPVAGSLEVAGSSFRTYADPEIGYYHRLLLPGTYDLIFRAEGLEEPYIVENVVVMDTGPTTLDVDLDLPFEPPSAWILTQ